VYYVDQAKGRDSNSGSSVSDAFRTIIKGTSVLKAGDTLFVRAGTYAESLRNAIPSGSSWKEPVTVAAYHGEVVIIKPPIGADRVLHFDGAKTQFISVEGFVLDGINVKYDVVKITYSGTELNHAHHIRIKNCEIRNSASHQGILSTGGGNAGNNQLIGLDIHHNGHSELDHGLYISSSNNVVERCRIHDNFGYGIHLYGSKGDVNNNIVRRNRIYNNGSITNKAGILISVGDRNLVHHNVVFGHKHGIRVDYNATNTKVLNNTVYGRDFMTGGISIGATSTGAIVRNNLVYRTYPGNEIDDHGKGTILSNNLEGVAPRWVNPEAGDFRLRSDSPAIDSGIDCGLTGDIDNDSLPVGKSADVGAYEYQLPLSNLLQAPRNIRLVL
jgi:parallel beta-helix repeat protein